SGDTGRGISKPSGVVASRDKFGKTDRERCERGADHAATNVGSHTLARAAKVYRVSDGKVVAPKAKLRDRHKAGEENGDVQGCNIPGPRLKQDLVVQGAKAKYKRQYYKPRHQEYPHQ